MKKILLILLISLISLVSFSQTSNNGTYMLHTYKNTFGYYNELKKEYEIGEYAYGNINFTVQPNYITCDDVQHSVYKIVENLPVRKTKVSTIMWATCTDEADKNCIFAIVVPKDGTNSKVLIMYEKIMYVYVIDK